MSVATWTERSRGGESSLQCQWPSLPQVHTDES